MHLAGVGVDHVDGVYRRVVPTFLGKALGAAFAEAGELGGGLDAGEAAVGQAQVGVVEGRGQAGVVLGVEGVDEELGGGNASVG